MLLGALLLEACADDAPTAPEEAGPSVLARTGDDSTQVVIEPHWLTLDTTEASDTLTATVLDADGDTIDDASVTWKSADTTIATVDTAGVVTSVDFGKTKVTATYDSVTAYATVEVAKPLTDREILEILYEATEGDDWTDNTNWLSDEDLNDWHGVQAYRGRVNSLYLRDNNLVGTLPPELGGLDSLVILLLSSNKLSGQVPPELSKFRKLRDLYLSRNTGIGGRLPAELGYTGGLRYLVLDRTSLFGPMPLTFANLDLTRLYYDKDRVCVPAALEDWFDSIPEKDEQYELCTAKLLIDPPSLYLKANSLGDTIRLTAAVFNAEGDTVADAEITWSSTDTAVATVDSTGLVTTAGYGTAGITAASDSLADTARVEIVFKLSDRQILDSLYRVTGGENWDDTTNWLSDEPLSEWYGVETGDSGEVVGLSLGDNNLTGPIPEVLAELDGLVTLDLGGNALVGEIPWDLRELERLRDLMLNGNALEGLLTRSLGYMDSLRYLDIRDNELSGVVPPSFARVELDTLYAAGSGVCVPPSLGEWFDDIERTDSAARCVASIAIEIVDLPSLNFYAAGETGSLEATYISAEGDTARKVSATWSSGDTAIVSVGPDGTVTAVGSGETEVTAAYDSASGTIAAAVDLPENDRDVLEILHDRTRGDGWTDATNWLSDEPLSEWAGVETDDSGRVVDLSLRNNNLRGPIHSSIGLLDRLVTLDLSRNWVSGPIPPEVGDLTLLRDLKLSVNGIVGALPSALGTMDSLRIFHVSVTSLSGPVPKSFSGLELESFLVGGTDMCVPPSLAGWLDSIVETDDPPECVGRVVVDPSSLTFGARGDTARITATVIDAEGDVEEDAEVTWRSDDTKVARVDTTGLVTARGGGVTNVTATHDSTTSARAEVAVRLPGGDRVALEALYRATGGDDWTDNTNWLSDEPLGEWYGVDTYESGRVEVLELPDNNLTGRIPAQIGLLDSLFILSLKGNDIAGPIPPGFGRLQKVRDLVLRETGLEGRLPPEMGRMSALQYLSLDDTGVTGPLPETFADLNLVRFYHSSTSLCVPRSLAEWYESLEGDNDPLPCIPDTSDRDILDSLYSKTGGENWSNKVNWLTEMSLNTWSGISTDDEGYVTEIFLPWNNMAGDIPPELGDLARLEVLSVYGNALTGEIPPELGRLAKVRELSLSSNRLEGRIPPEIGDMTGIRKMYLSWNNLSGPIPAEFGKLENLELLWLFRNRLSGPLPAEFGKLSKLKTALLSSNRFEGPLPPELGDMTSLEDLSLSRNVITGPIPPELGRLRNLKYLVIPDNELTGPIPPELGNIASLKEIILMRNTLSGGIPPELGKLSDLEWLWLFNNRLTGRIPAELGNLSSLRELSIGTNGLTGSIPPELGSLSALERLFIPRARLSGPIPPELGKLSSLTTLWLFDNELSGSIPAELGQLTSLVDLSLADNNLSGPLPPELGDLVSVERLGVSENSLSGPLPPELGDLVTMERLDVSFNPDLEGLMPRSMMNLPLGYLNIRSTDVCPHLDDEFRKWLDGIPRAYGLLCPSALTERFALMELYDSTGGDSWTRNDGWGGDSELDDWYGVTVEDSLVRELRLPGNGLEGPLPPALGSLSGIETLDLAYNDLTGGVGVAVTGIEPLDTIRVSDNEDMEGPLPFGMIELENLRALEYANTDLCASPAPTFQEWIDSLDVAKGATCDNADSVRLSLPVVYLTQAIQRPEGGVPLISGRQALLRVFLVGDSENAFFEPEVFATFTRDGEEVHRAVMPSEQDRVPTSVVEGRLVKSYNAVIPAEHVVDGTGFVIVADSAEVIPRAEGSRTRHPETGSAALDVIETPAFELTVVPVLNADEPDSSVFEWTDEVDDDSEQVGLFKYSFPVGEFTATSWDTAYVTSLDMTDQDNTWSVLLEVEKVYKSAEATGYWYAVADSDEGYVRGIARLNGLVSFGKPWATELAHEVGHNLDLLHAPCGGALGTDPEFPYGNGSIGVWGFDFRDSSLVSPRSRRDIMGYCYERGWLSDYYFEKVIEVRKDKVEDWTGDAVPGTGQKGEMLVLAGGMLDGELRIEPLHPMYTTASLPREPGPYSLQGITSGGDVEFSLSFTPGEDVDGNKYFLFTVPIQDDWEGSLERITLTGPEGEVTVDDGDSRVVTVVSDPSTGRIRAILRDWRRPLPAALGDTEGLEVVTTRGVAEAVRLR